jgi:hypothetical protein
VIPQWAKALYHAARVRAANKKIPFTITQTDLVALVEAADGRCTICGIPFEFDKQGHRVKRPFAPSMDRIDHKQGYVPGNVRFVSVAANVAMNVWGEAALRRLAEGICGHSNIAGMWSNPVVGDGTAVRKSRDGRYRYSSRVAVDGRLYSFGAFSSRKEAAERTKEVKELLAGGMTVEALLSRRSIAALQRIPAPAPTQAENEDQPKNEGKYLN